MKKLLKKTLIIIMSVVCAYSLCSCEYHRPYAASAGIELGVNSALHQLDKSA